MDDVDDLTDDDDDYFNEGDDYLIDDDDEYLTDDDYDYDLNWQDHVDRIISGIQKTF